MKPIVAVLGRHFPRQFLGELRELAEVTVADTVNELDDKSDLVHAIIEAKGELLDRNLLGKMRNLKIIARFGLGYDNVDIKFCASRGVFVTCTRNVMEEETVADLVMGLLLSIARKIIDSHNYIRSGEWEGFPSPFHQEKRLGTDVYGKTLGIVGLGGIGALVAERARAFKMKATYYDVVRRKQLEQEMGIPFMQLRELLQASDFITLHVPLTKGTYHMIDEEELRLMKGTAYIVNTSRGQVINELALAKALREGWIAGAALDVFAIEPLPRNSPLLGLDNVVLTPHLGGSTRECIERMAKSSVANVVKALSGETPIKETLVNPQFSSV